MTLIERETQLERLTARADQARAGRGGLVVVCGESGAGKTSFVEAFVDRWCDGERVLAGACDPLTTPRPLGPIHDLATRFDSATCEVLDRGGQPLDVFATVFDELRTTPSMLIIEDMHWADQATIDLLRFILRRIRMTCSLALLTVRDDEIGTTHPMRSLLGDVARSPDAQTLTLPPLSLAAITRLAGDRPVNPARLHRITGGNPFFVVEMLDHSGDDLPTTVRDAILARTATLDRAEWDVLHLLTCTPEALPDHLLPYLGAQVSTLEVLDRVNLIRRTFRGVTFRHDLCRLAVASVIPPGAEAQLHQRIIEAYERTPPVDPAVLTHHAIGAGDRDRIRRAASDAGLAAARSGAHTQAAEFYHLALSRGGALPAATEADLLERLAEQCYLTDQLEDAIAACQRALRLRTELVDVAAVSANHHALCQYEWFRANLDAAKSHAVQAVSVIEAGSTSDPDAVSLLAHALVTQADMAMNANELGEAAELVSRAEDFAGKIDDTALEIRLGLIKGLCDVISGELSGRDTVMSVIRAAPAHLDQIYSSGYTNLADLDVEQRRFSSAAELLAVGIPFAVERDLPICRVWQVGTRARLQMLRGEWNDAVVDADTVLDGPGAPWARTWPLLVRALIALRRRGEGGEFLDEAWRLALRFGEPMRSLPAAAAVVETTWLCGVRDPRIEECTALLRSAPRAGLEWARGELAVWLRRLDASVDADGVAGPYRLLLDGAYSAAASEFHRLSMPYEGALAQIDSGETDAVRDGLDTLDRLGADAVAAKIRRGLRSDGAAVVPARRRATTRGNPVGLTDRQIEVLKLLDEGLTNAEVAQRLFLSVKTVDHHVSAALAKLGAPGRRDAVRRAHELGILG